MKLSKIICFIFCSLLLLPLQHASMQSTTETTLRTISVSGSGNVTTVPDQATINIGVTTTDSTANTAEDENARISNNIQTTLMELGINKNKIHTKNYSFNPMYDSTENSTQEKITAYRVNNTVTVILDDITIIGKVIDASISSGANQINSINFNLKNPGTFKQEALEKAINDAQNKANIIAKTLNKHVVNVVSVSQAGMSVGTYNLPRFSLAKMEDANATPSINPVDININADVDIVFEMK